MKGEREREKTKITIHQTQQVIDKLQWPHQPIPKCVIIGSKHLFFLFHDKSIAPFNAFYQHLYINKCAQSVATLFKQNPCFQSFNSPHFLSFLCLTLMPQSWDQWLSDALLFKSEFQVEMWRSLALPRFGSFITVTRHSTGNLRPTSNASVTRSGFLP